MSDLSLQLKEVSKDDAVALQKLFFPFENQANKIKEEVYAIEVTDATQVEKMKTARQYRLKLKDLRIESEKTKKREKEESLRKGKAIDAVYNYILSIIEPMESHLQWQEDFAKREEEMKYIERMNARKTDLLAFGVDPNLYNIGGMTDEVFDALLADSAQVYEKKLAEAQAAEEKRIANENAAVEERKRMALENEKLKAEAEKQKILMEEERKKAQAERERVEKENRKKDEENKAALEKERKEREKIEAELQAQEAAKLKDEKEKAAKERSLQVAPDKEKLVRLADDITSLVMPDVTSEEAKIVIQGTIKILTQASKYLRTQAISL